MRLAMAKHLCRKRFLVERSSAGIIQILRGIRLWNPEKTISINRVDTTRVEFPAGKCYTECDYSSVYTP